MSSPIHYSNSDELFTAVHHQLDELNDSEEEGSVSQVLVTLEANVEFLQTDTFETRQALRELCGRIQRIPTVMGEEESLQHLQRLAQDVLLQCESRSETPEEFFLGILKTVNPTLNGPEGGVDYYSEEGKLLLDRYWEADSYVREHPSQVAEQVLQRLELCREFLDWSTEEKQEGLFNVFSSLILFCDRCRPSSLPPDDPIRKLKRLCRAVLVRCDKVRERFESLFESTGAMPSEVSDAITSELPVEMVLEFIKEAKFASDFGLARRLATTFEKEGPNVAMQVLHKIMDDVRRDSTSFRLRDLRVFKQVAQDMAELLNWHTERGDIGEWYPAGIAGWFDSLYQRGVEQGLRDLDILPTHFARS